jgi:hypothetical protein
MLHKKSPATKTTVNKIKKEAKNLNLELGSLQERQNLVAKKHGYENYHNFFETYKKQCRLISINPFAGVGAFSGEFILGSISEEKNMLNISQVDTTEYEITHRFELMNNQFSEAGIKIFCEDMDRHIQDYLSFLLKVSNDENQVNSYKDCIDLPDDYNLRSIDIAIGIGFPENILKEDEFKFADNWFYDEGKGGRITLSNFPNDGLVSKKAISILFQIIRSYAEKAFKTKCYVFPSMNHLDIDWKGVESPESISTH